MEANWSAAFERIVRRNCPFLDDCDPLLPDDNLAALGMDSMHTVTCMMEFEDEFQMELDDDQLSFEAFTTPAKLWSTFRTIAKSTPDS